MATEITIQMNDDGSVSSYVSEAASNKPCRSAKGKSLLENLENYIVLDLETTGLDSRWDNIIEIAALRVENNAISAQYHTLVNPGDEIDDFIAELTGITNEMLFSAPGIGEVLPDFLAFVGTGIIVAHNANFDVNFIYDNAERLELPVFTNDYLDTMRLSRRLFPEHRHHRLKDIVVRFGVGEKVRHRALDDATHTYQCYEKMKAHAQEQNIDISSLYPMKKALSAKEITSQNTKFDVDSPIFGNMFVFTGALQQMTRKEVMQLVVDEGGVCGDSVTKKTNYLVLGNNDYCATIKDGKSTKQKKAEQLQLSGINIEVISENVFYEMISDV